MGLDIRPIGTSFAAEVDGVDLTRPLTADEVAAIHAGMATWAVLVFQTSQAVDDLVEHRQPPERPFATREQPGQQPLPDLARVRDRGVESGGDLRLQARVARGRAGRAGLE
jgi:hypothetical protein